MNSIGTENILGYQVLTEELGPCLDSIIKRMWHGGPLACAEGSAAGGPVWLACLNPHSVVCAERDPIFAEALRNADWLIPDGIGVVLASRILGGRIRDRITGSDIFQGLNERLNTEGGFSCFFLGSSKETLARIVERMNRDYPNVRVVGVYSPPYKTEFSPEDDEAMLGAIHAARPDVLWVGMTAPKQEKWIYRNRDRLDVKFAAAVGAVFDFYAGNVKRSHPFFLRHGLEWLPRLLQEPRRLWRRNFISNPKFMARVVRARLTGH